jgi:hypothetical protein
MLPATTVSVPPIYLNLIDMHLIDQYTQSGRGSLLSRLEFLD